MDLFEHLKTRPNNLLPRDGEVHYYGPIIPHEKANFYLNELMQEIEWKNDQAVLFGKTIITNRKVAWYADEPFSYTYSKIKKTALPWTKTLLNLKDITEKVYALYPTVSENLNFIQNNQLQNIKFLYRKLDQFSWQYCNKGFFNFKNYIPKIIAKFN